MSSLPPLPHEPPGGPPAKTPPVKDAPAFDFYPERWLVGVAGMSDAEQISYLRLLCHQWLLGDAGLPDDVPALKRLAGSKGVTPAVLAKLPQGADGRRRNARLEVIRSEQRERIAKAAEKGRRMAAGRWGAKQGAGDAPASAKQYSGDAQAPARQCSGDAQAAPTPCTGNAHASAKHAASMAHALHDECPPPTTHHSPPTPVPEDANNAGACAREAEAAAEAEALAAAMLAQAQAAAGATAAEEEEAAARAAADAAADRAAAAEAAAAERAGVSAERKPPAADTPTLAMVQTWAVAIGCPPDKAEIWWHEHEARPLSFYGHWTDRDGNVVQRPQNALTAWWRKWQANDHQRSTRNHPPSTTSYHGTTRPAVVRSDSANAPGRYA